MKGQGVHTAFVDLVELLQEGKDVKVVVNAQGPGEVFHGHTYGPYYFWKGLPYKGRRIYTAHVIPDSIHGTFPLARFWKPLAIWYLKCVFSYADVVVAISPTVEEAVRSLAPQTSVKLISNPINLDHWRRTPERRRRGRAKLGLAPDQMAVLGVGQIMGRKGVEDFIEVAAQCPQARFIWVGGRPFGPFTEGISRINQRIAGAGSNIQFTGLLELAEMPDMYAAADLMLFPSYQENCPLAPLEAAASGLPVVFRDIPEYRRLFQRPYLKARDLAEFVSLTQRLISDGQFYADATALSRALVTQFDRRQIRAELMQLYKDLARRHGGPDKGRPAESS